MPAESEPEDLSIRRLRLFAGYSGWGAGQLEAELEEPSWIVVDAETDDAFADDPDELWRTVLHRKGGPFEMMDRHAVRPRPQLTRATAGRSRRSPPVTTRAAGSVRRTRNGSRRSAARL